MSYYLQGGPTVPRLPVSEHVIKAGVRALYEGAGGMLRPCLVKSVRGKSGRCSDKQRVTIELASGRAVELSARAVIPEPCGQAGRNRYMQNIPPYRVICDSA